MWPFTRGLNTMNIPVLSIIKHYNNHYESLFSQGLIGNLAKVSWVTIIKPHKITIFLWFSYGFSMIFPCSYGFSSHFPMDSARSYVTCSVPRWAAGFMEEVRLSWDTYLKIAELLTWVQYNNLSISIQIYIYIFVHIHHVVYIYIHRNTYKYAYIHIHISLCIYLYIITYV